MTWQSFPIKGFAPDLPNTEPGTYIVTFYCVPTDRGIGNGPRFAEASISATNTASLGGALLYDTGFNPLLYVGTATKLYQATPVAAPTSLTDRSGGTYNASTTDTWAFAQFGDVTLAINRNDFLQKSTGAAFSAVGGTPTPKAAVMTICGPVTAPVVMVFDFLDGTHTYRDGWFASGLTDYTGWVTGTNECAQGRLLDDVPGPITAAIGWRDGVLAFKRTGMYLGTYVGSPTIWQWERLSSDIGCIGKNAVCKANDVVYFADDAGVWKFDGSYPQRVPGQVHNYWALHCAIEAATDANRNFFRLLWDKPKHLLWVLWGRSVDPGTGTDAGGNVYDLTIGGLAWNGISGLWTQQPRNPFCNAQDANYAVEIIAPRVCVSKNKKVSLLTWDASGSEPRQALLASWVFNDRGATTWTLKGVRPQWATDDTTENAALQVWTYTSQASLTPEITGTGTPYVWTYRSPGKFDGVTSGETIGFQLFPSAGAVWELVGSMSADILAGGKA